METDFIIIRFLQTIIVNLRPGKPNLRGRLGTVDLVPTNLDQMLLIMQTFSFYKAFYLSDEVKCTESAP